MRLQLTTLALIAVTVTGCQGQPNSEFMDRRLCTMRGGECHPYTLTVGRLAAQCQTHSSAEWEITNDRRALLRCRGRDQLTQRRGEMAFLFDAVEQRGERLAAVTGISVNGLAGSASDIVNLISNLDADLTAPARR